MGSSKQYPKFTSLDYGDTFQRVAYGLNWVVNEGTYPVYDRVIEGVERVSEHKLIITLGAYVGENWNEDRPPSESAIISLYGEIDDLVRYASS